MPGAVHVAAVLTRLIPLIGSFEPNLLDTGLAEVANALRENTCHPCLLCLGKRNLIVAVLDGLRLALEHVVGQGRTGHQSRFAVDRIEGVAFALSVEAGWLYDFVAIGVPA